MDLSEAAFGALVNAAVHDPDPSSNRGFIEPALNAFGHSRVQSALLGYLRTGTDLERAGAARAWYWSALPLRMPLVRAKSPGSTGQAEPDDCSAGVVEWNEAALREFVSNEHLDVRRRVLPGLSLRKSAYPGAARPDELGGADTGAGAVGGRRGVVHGSRGAVRVKPRAGWGGRACLAHGMCCRTGHHGGQII